MFLRYLLTSPWLGFGFYRDGRSGIRSLDVVSLLAVEGFGSVMEEEEEDYNAERMHGALWSNRMFRQA